MSIDVRDHRLGKRGILVRDYEPEHPSGAALLWVHGGGFAGGSIEMPESDAVARRLAGAGRVVRTVEYRLAPPLPEHGPLDLDPSPDRYPAAQEDVMTAFADLAGGGAAFLGGASAGACVAASAVVRLRDEAGTLPLGLVLAYGLFHAALPEHADEEGAHLANLTDVDTGRWFERMTLNYSGSRELLSDSHVLPGEGDPRGLPDTLILDAEHDALRASGKRFAEQLRRAAVRTTEIVMADAEHGFLNVPASPHFDPAVAEMVRWMAALDAAESIP